MQCKNLKYECSFSPEKKTAKDPIGCLDLTRPIYTIDSRASGGNRWWSPRMFHVDVEASFVLWWFMMPMTISPCIYHIGRSSTQSQGDIWWWTFQYSRLMCTLNKLEVPCFTVNPPTMSKLQPFEVSVEIEEFWRCQRGTKGWDLGEKVAGLGIQFLFNQAPRFLTFLRPGGIIAESQKWCMTKCQRDDLLKTTSTCCWEFTENKTNCYLGKLGNVCWIKSLGVCFFLNNVFPPFYSGKTSTDLGHKQAKSTRDNNI